MIKLKRVISVLLTVLLTFSILNVLTDITELETSDYKYNDFFGQKENFDVLFMGTSHVLNGVFPMELWNDYGIVSYNFGGHSNAMPTNYWVMINALDYTKPKLMVIDCLGLSSMFKTSHVSYSYVHLSLDAFPFSINKIKTVFDLTNDPELNAAIKQGKIDDTRERTKLELLWNFSVYHSRWTNIDIKDKINISSSPEKGAESRNGVTPCAFVNSINSKTLNNETTGIVYLKKMIEYCKLNDIEVLLTYLPFPATEQEQIEANTIEKIAEDYNINCINFLKENIINYSTDCYDENSHLNSSGARKVTNYLGDYIVNHYDITDQRNNEKYSDWHDDYIKYEEMKINNFSEQQNIENYLMLMNDNSFDYIIEINDSRILFDDKLINLFKNIGINYDLLDNDTRKIVITNGNEIEYYKDENKHRENIFITVLNYKSKEVLTTKSFDY